MSTTDVETASRLEDLNIKPLDVSTTVNPVIVIHGPRESGVTSLIGCILRNLPNLNAAIVLSDRASSAANYMDSAIPPQLVLDKPADRVLKQLINVQQHQLRNFPGVPLEYFALALDDVFYTPRLLKSEEFQRDIKLAKDYNISVIMATADVNLLPNNIHTFATHVVATKCLGSEEPKVLHKRMFVMFEKSGELNQHLLLCRPYEFLVGTLRPIMGPRTVDNLTHTVSSTRHITPLAIPTALVEKLSLTLDKL
jgi:hypothetical protein